MKYHDLDYAIRNCLKLVELLDCSKSEKILYLATSDLESAFRILPLSKGAWRWLIMKAKHPISNNLFYFLDKTLPFGSRISCAHFTKVSNAIQHLVEHRAGRSHVVTNYLDDFLFIDLSRVGCNNLVSIFLVICAEIGFPVSMEKTVWAEKQTVFLGMLLLGDTLHVSVPETKRLKAQNMLIYLIDKPKATVKELERLCGLLNFLNRAVVPGRSFTRRMYAKFAGFQYTSHKELDSVKVRGILKPHHHVKLDQEFKNDCKVWLNFLGNLSAVCRPFIDFKLNRFSADSLFFYTDSSKNPLLGFGCIFNRNWTYSQWEKGFVERVDPSIGYLELYAACVGIFLWAPSLRNGRFQIWCDNKSACDMINSGVSKCKNCQYLLKMLALNNLIHNRRVFADYITSKANHLSDKLSRLKIRSFKRDAPLGINPYPDPLPTELWPASKLWQY